MSSWVDWDIEDNYGDNPTGQPGLFEFRVGYVIEEGCPGVLYAASGDGDPGFPPAVVIETVNCPRLHFDDGARIPTTEEHAALCDWFQNYLDTHPNELKELERRAFEYSYVDPGD